jgi:type II secretory pathway component PulF
MRHFRYNATDATGKWLAGQIPGESRAAVERVLLERGLTVQNLAEFETEDAEPGPILEVTPLPQRDLVALVEQVIALTRSGLPIPGGLRAAAHELESPRSRAAFERMASAIERGEPVDTAIARSTARFPEPLAELMRAGARTGRLTEILAEYVRIENVETELSRSFWSSVAYPLALLSVVFVLVEVFCWVSVTGHETMAGAMVPSWFGRRTTSPPSLVGIAQAVVDARWTIAGSAVGIPLIVMVWQRLTMTPAQRRRFVVGIPLVGPIRRSAALAGFCHWLALLIEADLPMDVALRLAGAAVGDADLAEATRGMASAVDSGQSVEAAVTSWPDLPPGLGPLLGWGCERRRLAEALRLAGMMYEGDARGRTSYAAGVVSAFLLLLTIWWVGFALASLLLPAYSLIKAFA